MTAPASGEWPIVDPEVAAAERRFVGSLTSSPTYPREGLIKRTLALGTIHVISYFTLDHVMSGALRTPSMDPIYATVQIPPQLRALVNSSSGLSSSRGIGSTAPSPSSTARGGLTLETSTSPQPIAPYDLEPFARGRTYSSPGVDAPPLMSRSRSSPFLRQKCKADLVVTAPPGARAAGPSFTASGMAGSYAPISPLRLDLIPSASLGGSEISKPFLGGYTRPRTPSLSSVGPTAAPALRRRSSGSMTRSTVSTAPDGHGPLTIGGYAGSSNIWPTVDGVQAHSASTAPAPSLWSSNVLGNPLAADLSMPSASTGYGSYGNYGQATSRRPASPSMSGTFSPHTTAFPSTSSGYGSQRPASPGLYGSSASSSTYQTQHNSTYASTGRYELPRPGSPSGYGATSSQQPAYSRARRPSSPGASSFSNIGTVAGGLSMSPSYSNTSFSTSRQQPQQQSQWPGSSYQYQQSGRYGPSERYYGSTSGSGGRK